MRRYLGKRTWRTKNLRRSLKMMWTSCRVNSKLRPNWAVIGKNKRCYILVWLLGPIVSILVVAYVLQIPVKLNMIFFKKKHLWNLTKGVFFHCSIGVSVLHLLLQPGRIPTVAGTLITSISASAAASITPINSGKSNPSSLTFIISWWHNVGGLNYPVTRDSASLKISSSKHHTAGTICILFHDFHGECSSQVFMLEYLLFGWMDCPFTLKPQMSPIKHPKTSQPKTTLWLDCWTTKFWIMPECHIVLYRYP